MPEKQNLIIKKNYSLAGSWFVYKNLIFYISKVLGDSIKQVRVVSGYEIEIDVLSKNSFPVLFFLNKHTNSQFKSLLDIICLDTPGKHKRFFIIYNLLSVRYNFRLRVITKVSATEEMLSLTGVYRTAG